MRFEYPNNKTAYLTAGYYPIGVMNTWHGGIHVEGQLTPIHSIADGEIIAYKISSQYLEEKIIEEEKTALYSNSFILIRHRYEYDKGKIFTFYSLYNHLQVKGDISIGKYPCFMQKYKKILAAEELHIIKGVNLRKEPNSKSDNCIGVIPVNTLVKHVLPFSDSKWHKVKSNTVWKKKENPDKKNSVYEIIDQEREGYYFNSNLNVKDENLVEADISIEITRNDDSLSIKGALLRDKPVSGNVLGIILKDTIVEILGRDGEWFKVRTDALLVEAERTDRRIVYSVAKDFMEGWCLNVNQQFDGYIEPQYDSIVSDKLIPVKSGDVIGYSGKFQSAGKTCISKYSAAHVEVFSNDDVPEFLNALKKKVTEENKCYKKEAYTEQIRYKVYLTSYKYTKTEAGENNLSPYDWEAFGFKVYDEDIDSYVFTDSPLLKDILKLIDENSDGKLDEKELGDAQKKAIVNELLSKMICLHRSEWAYEGDKFQNLKKEIKQLYDSFIEKFNPKNSKEKEECQRQKDENINRFEEKIKNLTFLNKINIAKNSTLEDGCFYYFHPIAFVDQMNSLGLSYRIGDKGKVVREINFRLAGFGCVLPGDVFTENTEKGVKQFQRDYMKMKSPSGIVDDITLRSIDEFSDIYRENLITYKCPCGKCGGFGKGQNKGKYKGNIERERYHKYEYPGMHQSLLWGVSAVRFYATLLTPKYTVCGISSAYRCTIDNASHNRTTVNHMGKSVDIKFAKEGKQIVGKQRSNLPLLEFVRDNLFIKYLNTTEWINAGFSTEPIGLNNGQTWSWIHLDVREFGKNNLKDEYFIKKNSDMNFAKKILDIKN